MDDHHVVWLGALGLALAWPSDSAAQNCKPNVSGKDRITKAQTDVWAQDVSSTGFLSQVVLEKANVNLNVAIARVGDVTIVQLTLTKEEEQNKIARAVLESQYQAAKGNEIVLGFKEGGTPLTFVASEATSKTEVKGLLAPKLGTTVVLAAHIRDDELSALRDSIGRRQFDVIRVGLSSQTIEKEMKGNGKKLSDKFACFFAFAEQRGFMKSAVASARASDGTGASLSRDVLASAPGKYVFRKGDGTESDYIELGSDGTFFLQEKGKGYTGRYKVQSDVGTFVLPDGRGFKATFIGNTIVEQDGTVLEKPAAVLKASPAPLTIEQIIQMVKAKIPDDIIIASIAKSGSKFDLTPEDLIRLKTAGVRDAVLRAMAK